MGERERERKKERKKERKEGKKKVTTAVISLERPY